MSKEATGVARELREAGGHMVDAARQTVAPMVDSMAGIYEKGKHHAVRAEAQLERTIADAPIKSILISAGVGALLGMLFLRR
jgi:ElaB/YqjD/DUF883 family membrane-anchored ribosome-binding protein